MCYKEYVSRTSILTSLRHHASDIRAVGVTSLYLFGSAARGEMRDESDINLFVDYDPKQFKFSDLIILREKLSQLLGRQADLTTRESLDPQLLAQIEAEAIKVF
jgi:predicted nucleotidyltransferase